jgi:hypothetical protein
MISYKDLFDFNDDSQLKKAVKIIGNLGNVYDRLIKGHTESKNKYAINIQEMVDATMKLLKAQEKLNPSIQKDREAIAATSKTVDVMSESYRVLTARIAKQEAEIKKLRDEKTKVAAKSKDLNNINLEAIKLEAQLGKLAGNNAKENAQLRLQLEMKKKAMKENARESLGLVSLYQKESKQLIELRNRYKDVALAQGLNSKSARVLQKEITVLDSRLKSVDANAGQFQRSVGNYPRTFAIARKSVMQFVSALGFTGVIFALVGALKSGIKTVITFQKENAVLAGILNKERTEIKELTRDAARLGAITAKTATEVTGLQVAYARLGFTQSEILELTQDTIDGSIAMDAALDKTAELTGAMVRTFDELSTTDAGMILDKMTLSTQKSALNFEKLATALPIVAGASNAAGISFDRTLALLGKLSDAGIDASMSSTSLRNIFIEAKAKGLDYTEILDEISNSTDKLTIANDEFGKRGAVSATILSNLREETDLLEASFENAGGTAARVAKTQLDTLSGSTQLLTSAWQGLILSIDSGDNAIGRGAKNLVGWMTYIINGASKLGVSADDAKKAIEDMVLSDQLKEAGKLDREEFNAFIDRMRKKGVEFENLAQASSEFLKVDRRRIKDQSIYKYPTKEVQKELEFLKARVKTIQEFAVSQDNLNASKKVEAELLLKQTAAENALAKAKGDLSRYDEIVELEKNVAKARAEVEKMAQGAFTESFKEGQKERSDILEKYNSEDQDKLKKGWSEYYDAIQDKAFKAFMNTKEFAVMSIAKVFDAFQQKLEMIVELAGGVFGFY